MLQVIQEEALVKRCIQHGWDNVFFQGKAFQNTFYNTM
jgi:hypothetical protein